MVKNGGEKGIRTLDTIARIHAFQACAFNHSATSPIFNQVFLNNIKLILPKIQKEMRKNKLTTNKDFIEQFVNAIDDYK